MTFSIFSFNMIAIASYFAFIIIVMDTLLSAQEIIDEGELF